ncbi:MAG: type II toxin-antitoxin system prevent-host-death family antitoxin [Rhodocyclaceae bacterium]|jgi:prevent-host-death family protein
MRSVSLAEAKAHLSELLGDVVGGEELVITRHGQPVARITPLAPPKKPLPLKELAALRKRLPAWREPSRNVLRDLREEA